MTNTMQSRTPASTSSVLVAACAIIALAYWLGASWLEQRVLGIPAGLYAIAVVYAVLRWGESLVLDDWFDRLRADSLFGLRRLMPPLARLAAHVRDTRDRFVRAFEAFRLAWCGETAHAGLSQGPIHYGTIELTPPPARHGRLRVGLDLPDHLCNRIMHTTGVKRIEWIPLREHALRPQELCRIRRLDAVVHRMGETICATPAQRSPMEPLWTDWARPVSPITYASVFPMRLDAARVSLGDTAFADAAEREIACILIEALIELHTSPVRMHGAPGREDGVLQRLASSLIAREEDAADTQAYQTACRVLSAYLCVHPSAFTEPERDAAIELCARTLHDEPEVQLRLAAVRFVHGRDDAGFGAILRAHDLLRACGRLSTESQLPFIHSELSLGTDDPMTFGRVAAGLCLCAAGTSDERLPFLREDILDEARFSVWLIDRDDERFILARILREIEHARTDAPAPLDAAA